MGRYGNDIRLGLGLALAFALGLTGCAQTIDDGGDGGFTTDTPPWSCEEEGRRPGPDDIACFSDEKRYVKGDCGEPRCDAGPMAPNCCPGQFCTSGGECIVPPSRYELCDTDAECDVPGMFCFDRPMITTEGKSCGWLPVEAGGCPNGGQPFNSRCVFGAPCGADCLAGSVCNIDTNLCEAVPTLGNADHGCEQVCYTSQILVYSDPDTMLFDACCEVKCMCLTLPPLEPGNWGRFSDSALTDDGLLISAYDATYGDLVLATANPNTGNIESVDYIDGVPAGGAVVADPDGPRNGYDGPGPDVGQYTAMALGADGAPHIAYWDVEAKALKLAIQDISTGEWSISFVAHGTAIPDEVDDETLDVGRYPSIAIDANGLIHLSYFAANARPNGQTMTGPMYARSNSAAPAGPEDWVEIPVEEIVSCNGQCQPWEACVSAGGVPSCRDLIEAPAECVGGCACDEICVDTGSPTCLELLPNRLDTPCDAACSSDQSCVDDTLGGTTCLPTLTVGCGACTDFEVCVEDDTSGLPVCRIHTPFSLIEGLPDGSGLFTSMVLHGDPTVPSSVTPTLVYYDRVRRGLRGAVAAFSVEDVPSSFATDTLVCDPLEDFGQHASLAVAPDGTFGVAFQGAGGETLNAYITNGADLFIGTVEPVDDGVRGTRLHLVGASADLNFGADGVPWIAYADQTDNDLLLAYKPADTGEWTCKMILSDGAYGSFARFVIAAGETAYLTTYLRSRDDFGDDASEMVIKQIGLDAPNLELLEDCWPAL